jgi:hypothetical protein
MYVSAFIAPFFGKKYNPVDPLFEIAHQTKSLAGNFSFLLYFIFSSTFVFKPQ